MKTELYFLLLFTMLFLACGKSDMSIGPEDKPIKSISLDAYREHLDDTYFKMWSDSSWAQYNGMKTLISGQSYTTILASTGTVYYYSSRGYAGLQERGKSVIIFDNPLALPDVLLFGKEYVLQTTFFYDGYNYTFTERYTLKDTMSIAAPVGHFGECLWFRASVTLSVGGQTSTSNQEFWSAIGPGSIKATLNSGMTIVMVRGQVNGTNWNMSLGKALVERPQTITPESNGTKALSLLVWAGL